jgi:hypothetical protein
VGEAFGRGSTPGWRVEGRDPLAAAVEDPHRRGVRVGVAGVERGEDGEAAPDRAQLVIAADEVVERAERPAAGEERSPDMPSCSAIRGTSGRRPFLRGWRGRRARPCSCGARSRPRSASPCRTTRPRSTGWGAAVSKDELQPGDLVFFRGLGHMGMYIGGGSFIHAPRTGDVVKISSLYESYYVANWAAARRVL